MKKFATAGVLIICAGILGLGLSAAKNDDSIVFLQLKTYKNGRMAAHLATTFSIHDFLRRKVEFLKCETVVSGTNYKLKIDRLENDSMFLLVYGERKNMPHPNLDRFYAARLKLAPPDIVTEEIFRAYDDKSQFEIIVTVFENLPMFKYLQMSNPDLDGYLPLRCQEQLRASP
ncbi:hypothetical protein A3G55_01015 [Candidatus Giovannonibacteria bacterium RIFCSPLOWO2_12_FULL_44_25]|uniref:Uncharacterized protein n=4 Tax=Parcubacteria group TaxID=1794811 RepID=A0A0G1LQW7_9BACT|nr:MAG: hypothetical protein UW15_C0034G0002 [Parcubacteria group bacterium GW2011_GWC1_44_10]KKT55429.1 MAG: hypothetical protein UW49_C0023G0002 [Candidatus Giovannonibacteria bacterium GW2011_GWB1_44_23]KKT62289.1 MAG: hypothetical protein UW57_C0019G0002 [Candidatus Giovannonibacteria bacterium GW2011_GWA1_44_29]KKU11973.1 MAG: hypothetical protein UX18_C0036G0001 [Candidatus Azambacteria bacterium GW2011_GWC2_45_7b]OGF49802.1 MAG: hypothetical protein A2120_02730 [Candidatus Giovannonibact